MSANTDEVRENICEAINGFDCGLVITALAQVTRMLFEQIDNEAPDFAQRARDDFNKHLRGPVN
jgi:hypothetical protein